MSVKADFGGNDLYVNTIYTGNTSPGQLNQSGGLSTVKIVLEDVNFNAANSDNAVAISIPSEIERWSMSSIKINNASHSLVSSTIGCFTGAGGTGVTIAADQAVSVSATATDTVNNTQALVITNATIIAFNDTTIYIRIGTAEGAASTADVVIVITPLS